MQRSVRAFTLIELLVVIGIIAVLAGLLIPAAIMAKKAAIKTRTVALIQNVAAGLDKYYSENGRYPEDYDDGSGPITVEDLVPGPPGSPSEFDKTVPAEVQTNNRVLLGALKSVDSATFGTGSKQVQGGLVVDSWGKPIAYRPYTHYPWEPGAPVPIHGDDPPMPDNYQLWSFGPDQTDDGGTDDDITNW